MTESLRWALTAFLLSQVAIAGGQAQAPDQENPDKPSHSWKASWITSPDAPRRDESILRFRKQLDLESVPSHFIVHVSADNQFLLMVNGKLVGTGPSHSDVQHWKYETYDIAPLLQSGANQIAATVWNLGDAAPVRQITNRIGFLIDCDTAAEADVKSDRTWDVAIDKGISTLPTPLQIQRFYYVASPAELLDGHSLLWDWDKATTGSQEAALWKKASIVGRAFARGTPFATTEWQLIPDIIPHMERSEQDSGRVVRLSGITSAAAFPKGAVEIPAHQEASLLIDAGQLTTAFPELTLSKGDHAKIVLTYAEALYDAGNKKGNRNKIDGRHILGIFDEIHPNGDPLQVYTPLEWRTWRYLQVDIKTEDQPLELGGLRTWFTAYPFEQAGSFSSDDPALKPIWDIGWRTARLCAHDTYMDTPYWERLQYTGDTRIQALISYAVAGDDRLGRQAIEAFHNSTIPEGITQSHYPASSFQSIPGFSLYWIGMVHDFWMYRDDPQFVRAQLPVVRSTLTWFISRQNKNGLTGRLPWWSFVDWANGFASGVPPQTSTGDSAILSLQLVEALRYAAEMEAAIGDKSLAAQDAEEAGRIAKAVYELCWSKEVGLIADTPEKNHFSQHANAFAVWLDVIPPADQQGVMLKILSASDPSFVSTATLPKLSMASFYYRFYLARALVHSGLGDRYLETLGPWKAMISSGLTTWAEQPEPTRSDSHAWSAHPNYDLLTIVAGISPASADFSSVRIEPHLGTLRHVDAAFPSPAGYVRAEFDAGKEKVRAKITLPEGLTGTFLWNGESHKLAPGIQELNLPLTVR